MVLQHYADNYIDIKIKQQIVSKYEYAMYGLKVELLVTDGVHRIAHKSIHSAIYISGCTQILEKSFNGTTNKGQLD